MQSCGMCVLCGPRFTFAPEFPAVIVQLREVYSDQDNAFLSFFCCESVGQEKRIMKASVLVVMWLVHNVRFLLHNRKSF
jgi:hypothetical protein